MAHGQSTTASVTSPVYSELLFHTVLSRLTGCNQSLHVAAAAAAVIWQEAAFRGRKFIRRTISHTKITPTVQMSPLW